jgi:hypothetical protein
MAFLLNYCEIKMPAQNPPSPYQSRTGTQAAPQQPKNQYPSQQQQTQAMQPPAQPKASPAPQTNAQPQQVPQEPGKKKWKIWAIILAVIIIAAGLGIYFLAF